MHGRAIHGCAGFRRLSRRSFLQVGALGSLGLTLPERHSASAAAPSREHSAILIFLTGGPSHHETFDPKSDAAAEVRGELGTVATSVAGVRFSDSVPLLAAEMKRLAIIRSVTHRDGAHEPGVAYLNTGYSFRPGHNFPGIGAVVSFQRPEFTRTMGLPSYVAVPDGRGGGHLGPAYNAFLVPGNPNEANFRVPDIALPKGLVKDRLERRRRLADQVNETFRRTREADVRVAVDKFTDQAYDMITSPKAQAAFDLSGEDAKTRERYGRSQLGQRLLLARRLVEAGIPFVAASDFGWDDHQDLFPRIKEKHPVLDRGVSALIADLDERGLLATTLVLVFGEFGRTPKINATRGRDHWPNAFSVLLAGAGVRGGQIIGASDKDGAFVKDRPVTPEELFHSIYVLLGIDPAKFLPSTGGREIEIVRDGKFIKELTS